MKSWHGYTGPLCMEYSRYEWIRRIKRSSNADFGDFFIVNLDRLLIISKVLVKWVTLTHWGRVTHICVSKLTIIGSDNGLAPGRRQTIIWTNDGILLIGPLGTNFTEILIKILEFSFKKMRLKLSSAKWRPFCLGLNVLNTDAMPVHNIEKTWVANSLCSSDAIWWH